MPATRWAQVLAAMLALTACSAPSTPLPTASVSEQASPTASSTATVMKGPPPPLTAKEVCGVALPQQKLLGWGTTTVGDLRAYHYGPPRMKPPLARSFPGVPDDAAGYVCVTRAGTDASAWWGVVDRTAAHAVTVNGPGEGQPLGRVSSLPPIP
jgi:hypothetical protein